VADLVARTGIGVTAAARELLDRLLAARAEALELVELSRSRDGALAVPGLAGELMPFQAAGVRYALRQRRVLLSDEQGLGKTVQALAAVEADGAYPAVVVCPASLKLNWAREARRWLPHRQGDITIINYERVGAWLEAHDLEPRALIVDESHYCKNPRAQRTRDVLALSRRLAPGSLRLALTGTPLVNRPAELVAQLRILDRLRDFGDGESFAQRFGHAAARERLHWHLRRRCYVRRLKREVLDQLPPKRRVTVALEIDNRVEYDALEEDLVGWIRTEIPDRLDAALRAQVLVKIGALRRLTARGKLAAALEWIESFAATGEKLVVFAHHREIQQAVLARFPAAARVLGTDGLAERDANVRRFQDDPEATLCVCSLQVAAHGFTLTAAANAAFLELGWTPAGHDQAEDRVHRITQDRAVTAWYLLAADTIDERIAALIDHKRAVVGSVTDGTLGDERSLLDSLLAEYGSEAPARRPLARA
jgi:SNF2 family DNA or RNA helicase